MITDSIERGPFHSVSWVKNWLTEHRAVIHRLLVSLPGSPNAG